MKSPIDTIRGRIVEYDDRLQELVIRAPYSDWPTMIRREYSECDITLVDGRRISNKQRKTVYALLKEISAFTGQGLSSTKTTMKRKFLSEDLCEPDAELFSLSDAPMSLVAAFQRYLVRFMLEFDVPCSVPMLEFVDDINDYVYACLVTRKCCICGKPSDLHHVTHVAMGRDREEIIHEGMEVLPLCRIHHEEAHMIGQITFNKKYHIDGGIILDKALCRLYNLNERDEENAEPHCSDGTVDQGP